MTIIRAAGGVVWRDGAGDPRVAVVHRPRRRDWTLPKGKLEEGEAWEAAALREVREETGCSCRLGAFAASSWYVPNRTPKVVLYWNMVLRREGELDAGDEVDEVRWLRPRAALERLEYESERRVLLRAVARRELRRGRGEAEAAREAVKRVRARLLRHALRARIDGESLGRRLSRLDRADDALAQAHALVLEAERVARELRP